MIGGVPPDPAEVGHAVVREYQPQPGMAGADAQRVLTQPRDSATRVREDRQPPLVGEREDALEAGVVEPELLRARVELDALRAAAQVGLRPEQIAHIAGLQVERLLDGAEPEDLGPAPGNLELRLDIVTQRIHDYCVAALSRMLIGDPGADYVGLARLACEMGEGSRHEAVGRSVLRLLDGAEEFVKSTNYTPPAAGAPGPRLPYPSVSILVIAANVAMTPDVPVP